jgi:MtfA peptidase
MGLFSYLRRRRREGILRDKPLGDAAWAAVLRRKSPFGFLTGERLSRLRDYATIFAREKQFIMAEGSGELDESDLALICAMACLPVLELGLDSYRGWSSIILRPEGFLAPRDEVDEYGLASDFEEDSAGLVLETGSVVLSLEDVREAGRGEGYNVVIHEMAHKLDDLNGQFDGVPDLDPDCGISRTEWRSVFSEALEGFRRKLESRERLAFRRGGGKRSRGGMPVRGAGPSIDPYAAEDPPEFFAVCCEHFFETPERLRSSLPEVYALLARYFRLDPLKPE